MMFREEREIQHVKEKEFRISLFAFKLDGCQELRIFKTSNVSLKQYIYEMDRLTS